jgi:hypothetical protein
LLRIEHFFNSIADGAKYTKVNAESPVGFHGVDVEGVTLGDSPNAETMSRGMPDFSASTGSLGSGKKFFPFFFSISDEFRSIWTI